MERMSAEEFDECVSRTQLGRRAQAWAYDVLVDGEKAAAVARFDDVPVKVVYRACATVRKHREIATLSVIARRLDRLEAVVASLGAAP